MRIPFRGWSIRPELFALLLFLLSSAWLSAALATSAAEGPESGRISFVGKNAIETAHGVFEIVSRAPLVVRGSVRIDRTEFAVGTPKNWNPMSITNEIQISFEATLPD